jgi:hypothetical protein
MPMPRNRHRWGEKVRFAQKTEQECTRCETVKVARHEWQAGREIYWTEYWRDLERIEAAGATPPCDARCEQRLQATELPPISLGRG